MLYIVSQCIQELLLAFFKSKNAAFNSVQEKDSIILFLMINVCHHSASLDILTLMIDS